MSNRILLKALAGKGFIMVNKELIKSIGLNNSVMLGELISLYDLFNGEEFFFQRQRLADDTGLSLLLVDKSLKELKKLGFITIQQKGLPKKSHYSVIEKNVYTFISGLKNTSVYESDNTSVYESDNTSVYESEALNNNIYNNNNNNNNNNNIYISSEKKEKENVENEMIINSYNKHFETNITDCKTTRKETNQLISSIKDYYKDISYDIIDNFFKKANESTYWMKNKAPLSYCCRYTNFLNIIQFEPKKQEKQKPKRR